MGPGGALSDPVVSAGRKPGSGRGRAEAGGRVQFFCAKWP